jgi:hypothetical protein
LVTFLLQQLPLCHRQQLRIARFLDDQIQRLRDGKKITISGADFLKARTDRHDKFLQFAADLYIEQIKWSLISPEKHGGWPVRSFIVEEPD